MRGRVRVAFVFAALFAVLASRHAHAARPVVHDPRRGPSAPGGPTSPAPRTSEATSPAPLPTVSSTSTSTRASRPSTPPRAATSRTSPRPTRAPSRRCSISSGRRTSSPSSRASSSTRGCDCTPPGRCVDGRTRPCSRSSARTSPGTRRCGESSPPGYSERTRSIHGASRLSARVVDLDVEALRSMDELIEGRTCLIGQEPAAHAVLLGDRPRHACNAWMASAPGSRFGITRWRRFRASRGPDEQVQSTRPSPDRRCSTRCWNERGTHLRAGAGWWTRPKCSIQRWTSPHWRRASREMRQTVGQEKLDPSECPPHVFASEKRGKTTGGDAIGRTGETPHGGGGVLPTGADGWANPSRETVVARGSYAVHHWVHTWLRDDATSNAWRRRT